MKKQHTLERFEIRLSGTGGQGVLTLGRILGSSLALGHGYQVTQTQSYGPEARGGASRTDLVVSSHAISYPKTESLDLLVALSPEACNSYYRYLKPSGLLVVDSGLVTQPPTNIHTGIPFTALAREKVGNILATNSVVLGALAHLLFFADPRRIKRALHEALPEKLLALNMKAFTLGLKEADKIFGPDDSIWKNIAAATNRRTDSEAME